MKKIPEKKQNMKRLKKEPPKMKKIPEKKTKYETSRKKKQK